VLTARNHCTSDYILYSVRGGLSLERVGFNTRLSSAHSRHSQADARVPELFVLLHVMLFTNIQFDDFSPTLAHFLERTKVEGAEECEWIVVAVANVGAILKVVQPSEWHVAQGWYCTSSPQCALIHLNEPASSACAVASTGNFNLLSSLHTLKI
jgi:hypothetical protein